MITDEKGNKLPQTKTTKKQKSAAKRERMKLLAQDGLKPKYCSYCGQRKRSVYHGLGLCVPNVEVR